MIYISEENIMYTTGSDRIVEWLKISQNIIKEQEEKEKEDEEESNEPDPFHTIQKIKKIVNEKIDNPENNKELIKILKKVQTQIKDFFSYEEEDEDEGDKQQPPVPPVPQAAPGTSAENPSGGIGDMGQTAPNDQQLAAGVGLNAAPASGGQM